jgi:hypothetical protein
LSSFEFTIKQQWTIEDISIFSNSSHLESKTGGQPYKQYFEVKPKYTPIFSSPGQRQCELLPSLGFLCRSYIISFHIYILSSEITEPN